jgi:hypothetical protein
MLQFSEVELSDEDLGVIAACEARNNKSAGRHERRIEA